MILEPKKIKFVTVFNDGFSLTYFSEVQKKSVFVKYGLLIVTITINKALFCQNFMLFYIHFLSLQDRYLIVLFCKKM